MKLPKNPGRKILAGMKLPKSPGRKIQAGMKILTFLSLDNLRGCHLSLWEQGGHIDHRGSPRVLREI
jgi:hypothetical protein